MQDLSGQELGRYRLTEPVGRSRLAVVYRAQARSADHPLAVKVFSAAVFEHHEFRPRFEELATTLTALRHPNMLAVHDFGEDHGLAYLVMDYIPMGSLTRRLGQPFDPAAACRLAAPLARALHFAHRRGLVHGGVKPANILLDGEGHPLLGDCGIAALLEAPQGLAQTGIGVATFRYASPEECLGLPRESRSDVYSLGAVLYEMLTGRVPFDGDTPAALALQHVRDERPSPRAVVPRLSAALEGVVLRALARKPEDRFATALQLAEALEAVVRPPLILPRGRPRSPSPAVSSPASSVAGDPPNLPAPVKRRRASLVWGVVLGGALLAGGLSGLGLYVSGALAPATKPAPTELAGLVRLPTPTGRSAPLSPTPTVRPSSPNGKVVPTATPIPPFRTFRSVALPYSMAYPSEWSAQGGVTVDGLLGDVYRASSAESFIADVSVIQERNQPFGTSSAGYVEGFTAWIRSSLGSEPTLRRSLTVDGQEAYWLSYLHGERAVDQVLLVYHGAGWAITLTTDPLDEENQLATFHQMLSTFRFNR